MGEEWRGHSNLECFLNSTTPSVQTHSLRKWPPLGKDAIEYFNLRELWDHYYEWGAYGAGVPIRLHSGETVVQYYVPYLSGIQIYTNKAFVSYRNVAGGKECKFLKGDSKLEKLPRSQDVFSWGTSFDHENAWQHKQGMGNLYFEFFENGSPHGRIPLADKVYEFAEAYPGLMCFKSAELSPASWMSVAWYPIYHIPARRNVRELTACFLTYHTISSSFQDNDQWNMGQIVSCTKSGKSEKNHEEKSNRISLPPFGLATYKMQRGFWMNPETGDDERIASLYNAATSWLKQLDVQHHDFIFFTSHSM